MNWKAAIVAVVCFATGLLAGSVFFRGSSTRSQSEPLKQASASKVPVSQFDSPTTPSSVPGSTHPSVESAGTNTTLSRKQTGSLADFEAALRNTRSRWDLGALYRALDGLDPSQYRDAMNACLKATDSMSRYAGLNAIGARWGQTDPQKALAFVDSLSNSSHRLAIIGSIVYGWAETDTLAAVAWTQQLPTGALKTAALHAVASSFAARDPAAAAAYFLGLPADSERDALLTAVAKTWTMQDVNAARAWARTLPEDTTRMQVMQTIASVEANGDLQAFADNLSQTPDGLEKDLRVNTLAVQWAYQDPQAASAWAAQLPPDDSRQEKSNFRNNLISQVAFVWANTDPTAAAKWVEQLAGMAHDQAAESVARQMLRTDPSSAIRLMDTIQNKTVWENAAKEVVRQWLTTDPEAAKKWVVESALPDDFKQRFAERNP